jgi:hypothetical protein
MGACNMRRQQRMVNHSTGLNPYYGFLRAGPRQGMKWARDLDNKRAIHESLLLFRGPMGQMGPMPEKAGRMQYDLHFISDLLLHVKLQGGGFAGF